jgi:hypothetical protein
MERYGEREVPQAQVFNRKRAGGIHHGQGLLTPPKAGYTLAQTKLSSSGFACRQAVDHTLRISPPPRHTSQIPVWGPYQRHADYAFKWNGEAKTFIGAIRPASRIVSMTT